MIKFFTKTRRDSLSKNRFGNYLLYAIGEILLVMIGILLALEVSNWNEERKERETEKSMLGGILKGLVKDSSDIEFNKTIHLQSLGSQKTVIKWIEGKEPFHDSLKRHISLSFRYTEFVSIDEPYENLKRVGTRLIANDTLREEISKVYDNDYDLYAELENIYIGLVVNVIQNINQDFFDVSNPVVYNPPSYEGEMTPLNPQTLRTDNRFRYHLKTMSVQNEMFIFYSLVRAQKSVENVKTLIRKELNKE